MTDTIKSNEQSGIFFRLTITADILLQIVVRYDDNDDGDQQQYTIVDGAYMNAEVGLFIELALE